MWSHNKGAVGEKNFMFTRYKFLLVTIKEWLKSVLNYRSYPKIKLGIRFFRPPCSYWFAVWFISDRLFALLLFCSYLKHCTVYMFFCVGLVRARFLY